MLEKPKTIVKYIIFRVATTKFSPAAHVRCCNGGVTVKNGFVLFFYKGAPSLRTHGWGPT